MGNRPEYSNTAELLGRSLVINDLDLVFGGASIGIMGVLADTVLANGGRVYGVMPRFLADKEIAHKNLSELHLVETMHERKELMFRLSDGFIALPGGLGTLEEFFEILTWGQLKIHKKPCGLLNVEDYFTGLINFLDHAAAEQFIRKEHHKMILVDKDPQNLLQKMVEYKPSNADKISPSSNIHRL